MSYIEKNLMDGEQIVYEARQHWIIYWMPALLLVVAIAQFAIPFDLLAQAIIALVLAIIAGIWALNIYGGRKYILTTKSAVETVDTYQPTNDFEMFYHQQLTPTLNVYTTRGQLVGSITCPTDCIDMVR